MTSLHIARTEWKRVTSSRLFRAGIIVVALIPLLYGALYLWAFWDPYGNLDQIPVAIVNLDEPHEVDGIRRWAAETGSHLRTLRPFVPAHLVAVNGKRLAEFAQRPSDTLARYGGEEFVILMPDTAQAEGIEAMTRLQRELTKAFYLSGKERVLITFSAGVAQLGRDETGADAIRRADQAMYLAKRAGKNRVMGA